VVAACLAVSPVAAQQVAPAMLAPTLDPSPPADTGKPRFFVPPPETQPGCAAVLGCRVRVLGAIRHNGAVELNGALFKW